MVRTADPHMTTVVVPCNIEWMSIPKKRRKIKEIGSTKWNYTDRQSRFVKCIFFVKHIGIIA